MSRPCASVPNQYSRPGGSSANIRLASMTGSECAIHGARTPTTTASRNSAPPTIRFAPSFIAASSVLDAWVDDRTGDVDQRVDGEEEQDDHENAALDGRDIALKHAVHEQRADTGPGEQLLHHDGLAHQ